MKNIFNRMFGDYKDQKLEIPNFERSEEIRAHIIFHGRVQGVGFRYNAYDIAMRLQLTGYVRNLQDGTVELEAQGKRDKIKFLIEYMKHLPIIKIEDVDYEEIPMKEGESKFGLS